MKIRTLGRTGLAVSELCFGVLPLGPSQFGLSPEDGGRVIAEAIRRGVNFLDTAQSYSTYPHIRHALGLVGSEADQVVISTKSQATTYDEMASAVEEALSAVGRRSIDIFHLHAARVDEGVFDDRKRALDCLIDMKKRGIVKAVGVSSHSVRVIRKAAGLDEIDVVFPIINKTGMGILHGDRSAMEEAIALASEQGKAVMAMKALAGGNLLNDRVSAINYVRGVKGVDSVAIGMVSIDEVVMNVTVFEDLEVPSDLSERTKKSKALIIQPFCKGCGKCVSVCPNMAMSVVNNRAKNDPAKCILCGYCAPVCPEFAIRLV